MPEGGCVHSLAPACGGSCPMPQFSCVPNGIGGCGCEAPACGRAGSSACTIGVCPNAGQACVGVERVYVVRAVKRTHGMRLITPTWRQERARRRALAPIPQKSNGHARNRHDR